jgi:hypothetical protein
MLPVAGNMGFEEFSLPVVMSFDLLNLALNVAHRPIPKGDRVGMDPVYSSAATCRQQERASS